MQTVLEQACARWVDCPTGTNLALHLDMLMRTAGRFARRRLRRKLLRSFPAIGTVVAIATAAQVMRRKGFLAGAVDTALDATPVLGTAKNLAEAVRGRDFIPERRASSPAVA